MQRSNSLLALSNPNIIKSNPSSRSSSRDCSPCSATSSSIRRKNLLADPMTILTFTTTDGDLIETEGEPNVDEHTIAVIDQSKCADCKLDMSPAATRVVEGDGGAGVDAHVGKDGMQRQDGIVTGCEGNPVTEERTPFVQNEDNIVLKQAGTPRAFQAASVSAPDGTTQDDYSQKNKHLTVLQQHITFFDRDNDGIIWPVDTWVGFRRLGYSLFISALALVIIHANFSYPTLPRHHYLPDPLCRIYIARIHKDKHGSDSGTYDNEGRFIPQKFEDIFAKYGSDNGESLTIWDTINYMNGQRVVFDFFGWGGAIFEWVATWLLLWPEDGKMKKDDIRRIFDGSLFYEIAEKREQSSKEGKKRK